MYNALTDVAFNQPSRKPTDINPLDAVLAADSDADTVWRKVRSDYSTLVGMFGQLNTLADALWTVVTQINGDTRLTTQAKAQDEAAKRSAYLQAVSSLREVAGQARQNVLDVVRPIINQNGFVKGINSQDTLVLILRTQDAWTRAAMVLDAQENAAKMHEKAMTLAKRAAEQDDTFTMSALRQNLPSYLEAHHFLDNDLTNNLNIAMAVASSPEMRAAMQIQQTLEIGWQSLIAAFLVAQGYGQQKTAIRVDSMPGWPNQPPVRI